MWMGYDENTETTNRNVKSLAQMAGQEFKLIYPVDPAGRTIVSLYWPCPSGCGIIFPGVRKAPDDVQEYPGVPAGKRLQVGKETGNGYNRRSALQFLFQ